VALDVPHADGVAQALLASGVIIDFRPHAGIRIAPHFYTTDAELEHAVALIDDILASERWRDFEGRSRTVT
jgi:kynureninase